MIYKTISELKTLARGRMLNNYGLAVSALVLIELIFFVFGRMTGAVVDITSASGQIIYFAITFIINLIATVLVVGELSIYLKLACGRKAAVSDVFSMFKQHPDKIIVVQLLIFVRVLAFMIPTIVLGVIYGMTDGTDNFVFILLIVCIIFGLIGSIYIKVITSQSFLLLLDFPQYSAKELIGYSKEIMKGHMWQYIGIIISFIPMLLLGVLSAGIGMLFVYPYYQMTLTQFYLDIIRQPQQESSTFSVAV